MTKDEIKALISAKVAGQGDQVDAGGALSEILNGIIDAIPEGGGSTEPLIIDHANIDQAPGNAYAKVTAEQYAAITNAVNTGRLVFITSEGSGYLQVFYNSGNAPFFLVSDTQDEAPRCCYIQIQE